MVLRGSQVLFILACLHLYVLVGGVDGIEESTISSSIPHEQLVQSYVERWIEETHYNDFESKFLQHKWLDASPPIKTANLRGQSSSEYTTGQYVTIAYPDTQGHCSLLTSASDVRVLRTNSCLSPSTDVPYHMKVTCDHTTGGIRWSFYDWSDSACKGASREYTMGAKSCEEGFQANCHADFSFAQDWTHHRAILTYGDEETAILDRNLPHAQSMIIRADLGLLHEFPSSQRMACNQFAVPSSFDCVDTSEVASMVYLATSFTTGRAIFYRDRHGSQPLHSVDYRQPVIAIPLQQQQEKQSSQQVFATERYLLTDWHRRVFP